MQTDRGMLLIARVPTLPPHGALIVGRWVDGRLLDALGKPDHSIVQIIPAPGAATELRLDRRLQQLDGPPPDSQPIAIDTTSDDYLTISTSIVTIGEKSAALIVQTTPRELYRFGTTTVRTYVIVLVATAIIFIGCIALFMERLVLNRLTRLSERIDLIGRQGDLSSRVDADGTDEIGLLADRLNQTLTALEQSHHQLLYQSNHDLLTGLPNRAHFDEQLALAIGEAQRSERIVALLFIDLDRFKQINDTLGHTAGDQLLLHVAQRLQSVIRQQDMISRMGGDEFTLVLRQCDGPHDAAIVARRLLGALHQPLLLDGCEMFVTASIGISLYPQDGQTTTKIKKSADNALYRAKDRGKNTFEFFAVDSSELDDQIQLEGQLRRAIERDELCVYYQPQVATDGTLVGLEALVRWRHPELGMVLPGRFIPLAEEAGLSAALGEWVMREVCRQLNEWQRADLTPPRVAINVSASQFAQHEFVQTVTRIILQTGIDPHLLAIELTEAVVMSDIRATVQTLEQIKGLGVEIAIDDFGTGYSSLSYLPQLPIDTIKIDRAFVQEVGTSSALAHNNGAILRAVTMLAHSLDMAVISEGVETTQQLDMLRHLGCERIQGFLFSPPMPADQATALIASAAPMPTLR